MPCIPYVYTHSMWLWNSSSHVNCGTFPTPPGSDQGWSDMITCAQYLLIQHVDFFPIVVETLGGWCPDAVAAIRSIGRALGQRFHRPMTKHLFGHLAIALWRQVCGCIDIHLSSLPSMVKFSRARFLSSFYFCVYFCIISVYCLLTFTFLCCLYHC